MRKDEELDELQELQELQELHELHGYMSCKSYMVTWAKAYLPCRSIDYGSTRMNTDLNVPAGTTDKSPRFQPWVLDRSGPKPWRGERKVRRNQRNLSSLAGLVAFSWRNPALNRRAIFEPPFGTWFHGASR